MSSEPTERTGVTPGEIAGALSDLRQTSRRLRAMETVEIARSLEQCAQRWLEDSNAEITTVSERVSASTGLSVPMVAWSIRELCRRFTLRGLEQLVESELGVRDPFSSARQRSEAACARMAIPPEVCTQYVAGTVPSVAIEQIALSLLARTPILLKSSSDEPHLAQAFVTTLAALSPELAASVRVMTWRGGDPDLDDAACANSDLVVIFGSDSAVSAMRQRTEGRVRFIGYGNRVSFGVIAEPGDTSGLASLPSLALSIALDTSAYDQRGCMSPHVYFVSRSARWSPDEIAESLTSQAFPRIEEILPRGSVSPSVHAAIHQLRGVFDFTGRTFQAPTATVFVSRQTRFVGSPGARTLTLVPYDTTNDLLDALHPLTTSLSTAALLCAPQSRDQLAGDLARSGVLRICRPGRMQRPVLIRDHDGRPRFADWMRWTSVEPSV